ncbi:hypothetical protein LguiA_013995 [Lonicera macranthoides]
MGAIDGGEEVPPVMMGGNEENIFVSVRVRPLNAKENARNDVSDWESINDNTIIYKNTNLSPPERSMYPTSYTFDRVFSLECSTRQVYKEGAKQVALSVVSGVNSSIFAYGQTSSGKTYTMTGITEYTIADIYDYVQKHTERDFILKFSAMEIYNESVRDLLSVDITPLRLLDDPERGTIVEKLTEETIRDWNHVIELLSICEAQRQIGETSLNETSSRSHQIIRLTIESSAREHLGKDNSSTLVSAVNFVDLAGSERASQTLSAGTRLKEGCHINRSLLTLGTVIRKLRVKTGLIVYFSCKEKVGYSKGRNGHIPFRDSKLTRILQSSLGGNARTAIICTMSPARSHVEQSRNTLLFASCAKEVTTNAQVNVVVSDKALVKHLQRELARLQSELKNAGSSFDASHYAALLQEKDARIEKVGLGHYPNLRVRISPDSVDLLQGTSSVTDFHSQAASFRTFGTSRYSDGHSRTSSEDNYIQIPDFEENYTQDSTPPGLFIGDAHFSESDSEEIEKQSTAASEDHCKDIGCTEIKDSNPKIQSNLSPKVETEISAPIAVVNADREDMESVSPRQEEEDGELVRVSLNEDGKFHIDGELVQLSLNEDGKLNIDGELVQVPLNEDGELVRVSLNEDGKFDVDTVAPSLKEGRELSCTNPPLVHYEKSSPSPWNEVTNDMSSSRSSNLSKSRSCKARIMVGPLSPSIEKLQNNEETPPNWSEKDLTGRPRVPQRRFSTLNFIVAADESLSREDYKSSVEAALDIAVEEQNPKASATDDVKFIQHDSKCAYNPSKESEVTTYESVRTVKDVGLDPIEEAAKYHSDWSSEFKRLQREIIELWEVCNVPLAHRAYFFLLFKGDPTDSIYMEVERRRLSFLKDSFSRGKAVQDGQTLTPASSLKALRRERQMLSKQMQKRLSEDERESLYLKWGVRLNSKNRRLQLADRLWSDTEDMEHITDSAVLVAKLVGFVEPEQAPKEMFALNFSPALSTRSRSIKSSLISLL